MILSVSDVITGNKRSQQQKNLSKSSVFFEQMVKELNTCETKKSTLQNGQKLNRRHSTNVSAKRHALPALGKASRGAPRVEVSTAKHESSKETAREVRGLVGHHGERERNGKTSQQAHCSRVHLVDLHRHGL